MQINNSIESEKYNVISDATFAPHSRMRRG